MKTEQILLAITINECGSITKAAQKLFMAQPNASNAVQSLEKELGYSIFERTPNGIRTTPKGEKFLQYAYSIQRNLNNISLLKDEKEGVRLFVASYAYPFAEKAFVQFCRNNTGAAESLDCRFRRIGTIKEGMDMLSDNTSDVSIFVCNRELIGYYEKKFKQKNLISCLLGYTNLHLTMAEGHPLAGREPLNLMDFSNYPCISNAGVAYSFVPVEIENLLSEVQFHIVTEPGDIRVMLLNNTENYSISTPYSMEFLKEHHLVSREIPHSERGIILLIREEDRNNKQILNYIELVRKEIPLWLNSLPPGDVSSGDRAK
ncbi:MAG: LysR family transcriptional regulator [Lachnospiraceae bacterium]